MIKLFEILEYHKLVMLMKKRLTDHGRKAGQVEGE